MTDVARATITHIAYDGEALRSGSMDVRDLAPALLAIGDLLQHANRILNDDRAQLLVKVRSDFQRGSFQIDFDLVQTLASQVHLFITREQLATVKEIAEYVGLAGGGIIGALKLIKLLKGEAPKSTTQLTNGNVSVVINGDHNHVEVKPEVLQLVNDLQVRQAAADVMKPLQSAGVERFEVRRGKKVVDSYTREDLPAFEPPTATAMEIPNVTPERTAIVEIIKPSFENDLTWVFDDGGNRINAYMRDAGFLERVQKREVAFTKGIILRVRLSTKVHLTTEGLTTSHQVVEVIEVIPPLRQVPLIASPELPPIKTRKKKSSKK